MILVIAGQASYVGEHLRNEALKQAIPTVVFSREMLAGIASGQPSAQTAAWDTIQRAGETRVKGSPFLSIAFADCLRPPEYDEEQARHIHELLAKTHEFLGKCADRCVLIHIGSMAEMRPQLFSRSPYWEYKRSRRLLLAQIPEDVLHVVPSLLWAPNARMERDLVRLSPLVRRYPEILDRVPMWMCEVTDFARITIALARGSLQISQEDRAIPFEVRVPGEFKSLRALYESATIEAIPKHDKLGLLRSVELAVASGALFKAHAEVDRRFARFLIIAAASRWPILRRLINHYERFGSPDYTDSRYIASVLAPPGRVALVVTQEGWVEARLDMGTP